MKSGLIYDPADMTLADKQGAALELLYDYNATRPSELAERSRLLKEMFARVGDGCYIEPPFHANWGGANVHLGNRVYANFNLVLVDDGPIYVGDDLMFGPNVTLTTAGHPILPQLRVRSAQFNLPIRIGNNVWLGSGVQVLPGISIGDNTVVGAGSVVTRDLPENVVAVGTPCRPVRKINDQDRTHYWRDRAFDMPVEQLIRYFDS